MGIPWNSTVIETTDTSAPSSLSEQIHSAFKCGNKDTMTCRSM